MSGSCLCVCVSAVSLHYPGGAHENPPLPLPLPVFCWFPVQVFCWFPVLGFVGFLCIAWFVFKTAQSSDNLCVMSSVRWVGLPVWQWR